MMFPYKPRRFQKDMMDFIERNIGRNICIHAPTGFGKTPVILSSLLKSTKESGLKILWCVRTGNETDRPIEELKVIARKHNVFGISFRGKKDMCLLLKDMNLDRTHSNATFLCSKKKKECRYYRNLSEVWIDFWTPTTYSEILKFCSEEKVCPYYIQKKLLPKCDVISLNYNYILNKDISSGISSVVDFRKCLLVVDEAHNLRNACINNNSDRITLNTIVNAEREAEKFEDSELTNFIKNLRKNMVMLSDFGESTFDMEKLVEKLDKEYFEVVMDYGIEIRKKQLSEGKNPHSSLYRLGEFFLRSISKLGKEGVVFVSERSENNLIVEMIDMRTEILGKLWNEFASCIFCSGTLRPIKAFTETIGLEEYEKKKIPFVFDTDNVKSFVIKGVTTKGEELKDEMKKRYGECIRKILSFKRNTALFFSSYRIMENLLEDVKDIADSFDMRIFSEYQGMGGDEARKILDDFKKHGGVLCASIQGRFSEGIDLPGKELETVFVIGVPFDRLTLKTKLFLNYYRKVYGINKGTYYGYVVPAMIRVSQAMGRALRSEQDKAIFILGDERYLQPRLFRLLPEYVKNAKTVKWEDFVMYF